MSDQSSSFPFPGFGQEEGLDVAAIFGNGAPASRLRRPPRPRRPLWLPLNPSRPTRLKPPRARILNPLL